MAQFKIYKVGGSIRNRLMGIPSHDNDYVVVGATVNDMIKLGFKPIGSAFPVFLHPKTHEEYALARTEKKTGIGYKGFTFHTNQKVTLEEDLNRRDITINAIAEDKNGNLIDPFGGIRDIKNKIIRHVSPAFSEDPLRLLRVARFASQFNFIIAPETLNLMKEISNNPNELKSISKERIQTELDKVIISSNIIHFLEILYNCGALQHILTEFSCIFCDIYLLKHITKAINKYKKTNYNLNLDDVQNILVILYYFIVIRLNSKLTNEAINNSLLKNNAKQLLHLLLKNYAIITDIPTMVTTNNYPILLEIINRTDPLRRSKRFLNLTKVLLAIGAANNDINKIKYAIKTITQICSLFKQFDFASLTQNHDTKDIISIIYHKKLAIIETYLRV